MGSSQIKSLGQLQVLVAALVIGIAMAGAAMLALRLNGPQPGGRVDQLLVIVTSAVWFGGFSGSLVIRAAVVGSLRRASDAGRTPEDSALLARFATLAIIRGALMEGPALLGCVAFFLTGSWPVLAAPVMSILVMSVQFPTRAALDNFLRDATGHRGGIAGAARP